MPYIRESLLKENPNLIEAHPDDVFLAELDYVRNHPTHTIEDMGNLTVPNKWPFTQHSTNIGEALLAKRAENNGFGKDPINKVKEKVKNSLFGLPMEVEDNNPPFYGEDFAKYVDKPYRSTYALFKGLSGNLYDTEKAVGPYPLNPPFEEVQPFFNPPKDLGIDPSEEQQREIYKNVPAHFMYEVMKKRMNKNAP